MPRLWCAHYVVVLILCLCDVQGCSAKKRGVGTLIPTRSHPTAPLI